MNLTDKETVELRIKCIESVMPSATKISMESGSILNLAEQAWQFAIRTLGQRQDGNPEKKLVQRGK